MIDEVVVSGFQHNRRVYFQETLTIRVRFLHPSKLHGRNTVARFSERAGEDGIALQSPPRRAALDQVARGVASELKGERCIVCLPRPMFAMPSAKTVGPPDVEVIFTLAEQVDAATRHIERKPDLSGVWGATRQLEE